MPARNWSRLDEDTGVLIKSIELVKIPLTFTRHLFHLSFTDSNLLMELAAGPRVCVCDALLKLLCDDDLLLSTSPTENSCTITWSAKHSSEKKNKPCFILTQSDNSNSFDYLALVLFMDLVNWNMNKSSAVCTVLMSILANSIYRETMCIFTPTCDNPFL